MAKLKSFVFPYTATGSNLYCIVIRAIEQQILTEDDGDYAFMAFDDVESETFTFDLEEIEVNSNGTQVYLFNYDDTEFIGGHYYAIIYEKSGASKDPETDLIVGQADVLIREDKVVETPYSKGIGA